MNAHAYADDPLVVHPAVGLFAELGWIRVLALVGILSLCQTRDLPQARLLSGQVTLASVSANGALLCQPVATPQVSASNYQVG